MCKGEKGAKEHKNFFNQTRPNVNLNANQISCDALCLRQEKTCFFFCFSHLAQIPEFHLEQILRFFVEENLTFMFCSHKTVLSYIIFSHEGLFFFSPFPLVLNTHSLLPCMQRNALSTTWPVQALAPNVSLFQ